MLANRQLEFGPKEFRSIKGKKEKVPVYFVTGVAQDSGRDRRRGSLPLVGRARETATARDLLADVRNGHGAILHIAGEPGIGKTRFIADISDWAAQEGFRVLSASASPLSAIDPYSLWRQILDQLIGVNPASGPPAAESALMTFLESSAIRPRMLRRFAPYSASPLSNSNCSMSPHVFSGSASAGPPF